MTRGLVTIIVLLSGLALYVTWPDLYDAWARREFKRMEEAADSIRPKSTEDEIRRLLGSNYVRHAHEDSYTWLFEFPQRWHYRKSGSMQFIAVYFDSSTQLVDSVGNLYLSAGPESDSLTAPSARYTRTPNPQEVDLANVVPEPPLPSGEEP